MLGKATAELDATMEMDVSSRSWTQCGGGAGWTLDAAANVAVAELMLRQCRELLRTEVDAELVQRPCGRLDGSDLS